MYKILTLNKISECGLKFFDSEKYIVGDKCEDPDAIILRSFNMHEMEIPASVKAIARAGAGVNNIPIDKCSERGIVVFNTPGANANAVKELAVAALLLSSRKIVDGINWVRTLDGKGDEIPKLVEKGKSQFVGPEIEGKKLAVIGLGSIGVMVANAAYYLGMDVTGYDPYISVKSALGLSRHINVSKDLRSVIEAADYITLHVPLNDETREMINKDFFAMVNKTVRLINLSRGELVNDDDLKEALVTGKVACYVTDFPNQALISMKNVITIPHLGASTPESEDNCAAMASKQLIDFIENGNIVNSVNFPDCEFPRSSKLRVTIAHKNIPNMLTRFSGELAKKGFNIDNMLNKSKKDMAYTIIEADSITEDMVENIKAMDGVLSVRVIE